jgi:hypothetical protein
MPSTLSFTSSGSTSISFGVVATLTAQAAAGSQFTGWGGACAGASGTTCTVTMDQAKGVTAEFTAVAVKPASLWVRTATTLDTNPVVWGASTTADVAYEVEEATDGAFTQNVRQVYSGSALSCNVTVAANGSYYYRVRAVKPGYQPSGWVNSAASVVTLIAVKPASLWVRTATTLDTNPVVWGASTTADVAYEVEEATDGAFTQNVRQVYSGSALSCNVTVAANGSYYYRVRAVKPGYQPSGWVNSAASVVTLTAVNPASLWVRTTTTLDTNPVVWGASTTAGVTYEVQEAADAAFTQNMRMVYTGTALRSDVTIAASGTYYYRVRAVKDGYQPSGWVNSAASVATLTAVNPASLWVRTSTTLDTNPVVWGASTTVGVTYEVQEATDVVFTQNVRQVYSGIALRSDVTVAASSTYYYRARAVKDGYQPSGWVVSAPSVINLTCVKPASLWARTTTTLATNPVVWGASTTADVTYEVEEATDGAFTQNVRQVYSGSVLRSDVTVAASGTYYYRVRAVKPGYQPSGWMVSLGSMVTFN